MFIVVPTETRSSGWQHTLARAALTLGGSAALCVGVTGCAYGELKQVLRTEAAAELDCPSVQVEPRNAAYMRGSAEGDNDWKVRGCGIVRTYTCPPDDDMVRFGSPGCTFVDGDVDAPELATDEGDDFLNGDMDSKAELDGDMDSETD